MLVLYRTIFTYKGSSKAALKTTPGK